MVQRSSILIVTITVITTTMVFNISVTGSTQISSAIIIPAFIRVVAVVIHPFTFPLTFSYGSRPIQLSTIVSHRILSACIVTIPSVTPLSIPTVTITMAQFISLCHAHIDSASVNADIVAIIPIASVWSFQLPNLLSLIFSGSTLVYMVYIRHYYER